MGWLQEHLDNFVTPVIGKDIPSTVPYFLPAELTVIKNCWKAVRTYAGGRTILLPGRDVWVFEVLARRENYPTVFMPECSRATVSHIREMGVIDRELLLLDTGFMGSIPICLGMPDFKLLSYWSKLRNVGVQVFPKLTGSRGLALKIEYSPKYWESGRVVDNRIVQPIAKTEEFRKAAQLTIEVYRNSAPKFVDGHKPILTEGVRKWKKWKA